MRVILSLVMSLVLAACSTSCTTGRGRVLTPGPIPAASLADSTRHLDMDFEGEPIGSATAWLVGKTSVFSFWITAGHACEEGLGYTLVPRVGVSMRAVEIADSDDKDICLLASGPTDSTPLPVTDHDPEYGAWLEYVGSPVGLMGDGRAPIFEGHYCGRADGFLTACMPGYPGASGSAVVDSTGHVVGILVRVIGRWPEVSFLAPWDDLADFLDEFLPV